MENNMKQFNLPEYLANPSRQVVTRDGRKVTRFLCTDAKTDFPIIALLEATPGSTNESLCAFKKDGRYFEDVISNCDLFFAPEKHEAWINLYRDCCTGVNYPGCRLFNTKKEAKQNLAIEEDRYIATIKIEWEEQ